LRLVVYPIIYRVLYIPGAAAFLPSTALFGSQSLIFRSYTRQSAAQKLW